MERRSAVEVWRSARHRSVSLGLAGAAVLVTVVGEFMSSPAPLVLRPFDHGFNGVPAVVHLGLNLVLLFLLGTQLERAQGICDTLLLTALAYLAYLAGLVLAAELWDLEAVGLSGIVWAWLMPARFSVRSESERQAIEPVFWLMLVWIPLGFAVLIAARSTDQRLTGALLANFFHGVGAAVGLLFAVWRFRDRTVVRS